MLQIDSKGAVEAKHVQRVVDDLISSHVATKPPCGTDVVNFDFLHAQVLSNNLGGEGPGTGPEFIRLGRVGNLSGEPFDMKIETLNEDYKVSNPKLNHAKGHTVQINLATTKEAQMKFTLLWPGTDDPVTLPAFYISVFDIDQNGHSGEQVFVKGYDEIIIPEDKEYDVEDTDGGKTMTSKIFGRLCDNPTDPWNLTMITCFGVTVDTRRRSFTMLFKEKSSFELTFRVLLLRPGRSYHNTGRNLLIAGPSDFTEPCPPQIGQPETTTTTTPQCDPQATMFDFSKATILHNNLGNMGPDSGAQSLRYGNVGNAQGDPEGKTLPVQGPIDMIVETLNPDFTSKKQKGLKGKSGIINVYTGSKADMKFTFVWAGTNDEVELEAFYITILDLDIGWDYAEMVDVRGYDQIYIPTDHEYDVVDTDTGKRITATKRGNGCDNPVDPMSLIVKECAGFVVDQRTRTFTMLFKKTSSFSLSFAAPVQIPGKEKNNGAIRNLLFSGVSELIDSCHAGGHATGGHAGGHATDGHAGGHAS